MPGYGNRRLQNRETCSAIAPSTGRQCRSAPQPGFETCRRHRAHENGIVNAQCTAQTQRGAQCRMQARPGYNTCLRHATVEQQQQPIRQPPRVAGGQRGQAPLVELTIQQVRDLCYLVSEGFSTADIMVVLGIPNEPEPPIVPPAAPRRPVRRRNRLRPINPLDLPPGEIINIITRPFVKEPTCNIPVVEPTCAVCISDYPDMVAPVETDCGHVFCKECITDWACTNKHNSCPTCRKELV